MRPCVERGYGQVDKCGIVSNQTFLPAVGRKLEECGNYESEGDGRFGGKWQVAWCAGAACEPD